MELAELGKQPIPGANPVGEDARFEPEFEELDGELGKLSSPTASGAVDWAKVVNLSTKILAEKSKNLTVATYLCISLMQTEKLSGLAGGVHVLKDLLENFWETMYPPVKRMRGRVNAFAWWHERIDARMPEFTTETWPKEKKEAFTSDLSFIDSFLAKNTEDAPILRSMIERITGLIEIEPEPVSEPTDTTPPAVGTEAPAGAPPTQPTAKAAPAPAPSPEGADADGDKLLRQGFDILGRASTLLLKKEPISIVPFRLNRIIIWLPVQNLPPATDGQTMIPPPEEQVISSLRSLYQSSNWRELMLASEGLVRQYLFWFDLSRFVAESLEQLRYSAISETVARETADFVKRLPGIEKMAFSDGTPFADDETKEWLKTAAQMGGGGSTSSAGSGIEHLVENEIAEAQKLIMDNKMNAALGTFIGKVNQASSVRERFLWKIGLCKLLSRVKKPQLVVPYIQEILSIIDEYKIERWEPVLAVEGLVLALSGLRLQGEKKDDELIEKVLNRISALDPARAIELL